MLPADDIIGDIVSPRHKIIYKPGGFVKVKSDIFWLSYRYIIVDTPETTKTTLP